MRSKEQLQSQIDISFADLKRRKNDMDRLIGQSNDTKIDLPLHSSICVAIRNYVASAKIYIEAIKQYEKTICFQTERPLFIDNNIGQDLKCHGQLWQRCSVHILCSYLAIGKLP